MKYKSLEMLLLLYHSSMTKVLTPLFLDITPPFFKFLKHLKKHITFRTYLLPCPAVRIPVTSSRRWGTVGHLAECSW